MTTPTTHIVIPARFSSTRLPGKPLLNIHGRAMILRVVDAVSHLLLDADICVATDDARIKTLCESENIPVVMTSSEHPSGTDRLAEVASIKGWGDNDIVINVQGDEPLIPTELLTQVHQLLSNQPQCAMATLCEQIDNLADFNRNSIVKVVRSQTGEALYFSRSPIPHYRKATLGNYTQKKALPDAYRHLGLYAYRVQVLRNFVKWPIGSLEQYESLEQLRLLENGAKIAIAIAKVGLPAGVDTPEDLDRLNALSESVFFAKHNFDKL